jgi:hypothetical protein
MTGVLTVAPCPKASRAGRMLLRVAALGWRTRGRAGTQEGRGGSLAARVHRDARRHRADRADRAHPGTGVLVPPIPGHPRRRTTPEPVPSDRCGACRPRRAARLPARDALPYSRSPRAVPDAPVRGGPAGRRRTGTTVRDLVRKGGGGHAQPEGVLRPYRSGGRALRSRGAALRGRAPRFIMRADASRGAVRHGFVRRHPDPPPGSQPVARTGRIGLRAATAVRW